MSLATAVYRGQVPVEALDPGDRGLAYGDGLFETIRVHESRPVWWEAHLRRLDKGAAVLGIAMPAQRWLAAQAQHLLAAGPATAILKLILTRGAGGRGYAARRDEAPTLVLALHSLPAPVPTPLVLRWCSTPVAIQPTLAGLKHLNRLEQVLARAEWSDDGIHEGLMLDTEGHVACATAANVFILEQGRWLTPPVDRRGVAGVAREWLLANDATATEAELTPARVEAADALFLCNAVRGILPVGKLGERAWAPHPGVSALRQRLGRDVPAFATGR